MKLAVLFVTFWARIGEKCDLYRLNADLLLQSTKRVRLNDRARSGGSQTGIESRRRDRADGKQTPDSAQRSVHATAHDWLTARGSEERFGRKVWP